MKNTKSSRLIGLLSACLLLLAGGCVLLFGQSMGIGYADADKYSVGNTSVSSPVEALDIHWTAGRLIVEYHDGSDILVSETSSRTLSEDDMLRWWLDGTTLRVQYRKEGIRFALFSGSLDKTLTVSLPRGTVLKSASLQATSADISVPELAADDLHIETTSGRVDASAKASKMTGGSTSGDWTVSLGSVDTVSLSSTSGSIGLTLQDAKEIVLSSTSGGVSCILSGNAESVNMKSTSGSVALEASKAGKSVLSSTSGGIHVAVSAFDDLSVDCTSGTVTAVLPDTPGFTGDFHTTSGSFNSEIALEKNGDTYTCGSADARCRIHTTSGSIRISKAQ